MTDYLVVLTVTLTGILLVTAAAGARLHGVAPPQPEDES